MSDIWETKRLGQLAEIAYGYTAKASYELNGPKFLRITDLTDTGVDWETVPTCPIKSDDFEKHKLQSDDIVFARTGATTGKSYLIQSPPASVAASYLIRLRLQHLEAHPPFIGLYFQTKNYWDAINSGISGSAQGGFNASKLSGLTIPLPPLAQQKRIVSILDEAFSVIAKAKENAEKNLASARELFESYLNRVFTQQGPGWEEKNLADVAITFGRGKSRHRPRNEKSLYGGRYPFIQTGEIRNANHYVTEFTKTYSEKGLAQSKLWPVGTLCITIAANIAETAILTFDACIPDSVIGLVPDPAKANVEFVEFLLQFFKSNLQAQGKGSAQDNINMGTFERNEFPFAPLDEQARIVEALNELAAESQRLQTIYTRKLANLDELKQSLLQKAFTGQLTSRAHDLAKTEADCLEA